MYQAIHAVGTALSSTIGKENMQAVFLFAITFIIIRQWSKQ